MMAAQVPGHEHFHYEIVTVNRAGKRRTHAYASDDRLGPGSVVRLSGRYWLIEEVAKEEASGLIHAVARPARYRLRLRHPDGGEEIGALRRFRPGAPRLGHAFTTLDDGRPVSWAVVDERLARADDGEPCLDLVAERDFTEFEESVPDHELEHILAAREEDALPEAASGTLARAEQEGLSLELVALEPGEEPDWAAAERFIDALVLEEVEDDLIELCGVDTDRDPHETWLAKVKERLRSDLAAFRDDVEGDLDEIEEWSFRDGRIFASVGREEDEADPASGHGWMCRLVDSEALGAAGFARVRKTEFA
jgi:hypothetical protein